MKIDRLVSIILVLLEKKRIGARELASMYEVSLRTIYRDIDAINLAGVPIRSIPGVGGGFEIMPQFKIGSTVFSTADLSVILMGLSSLSSVLRGNELVNAFSKVKSFIPAEKARDIEVGASQILIDLSPWSGNKHIHSHLELIKTALRESRLLSFEYTDRYGIKSERIAEPYQLVLKNGQWYWQGFCRTRGDFRLFKVNRITGLAILEEGFSPRAFQKPRLDIPDELLARHKTIVLRVHNSLRDRVLDYCADGDLTPDGDDHWIVRFPFVENDYYFDILLGFGKKCECVEPLRIRKELKRRIDDLAEFYKRA